ncbi:hypothetical protein L3Y34_013982 [Caenorhabditis briggsae]|uniref:UBX domain-containing protein n=1 Tax=Caenorhabditis briggsae TaxID=6238 RepID=A0AAE9IXI9_CAEBR|nr:hypothetical protein L3Y34_013982 [Caenorhabditis briggsae]
MSDFQEIQKMNPIVDQLVDMGFAPETASAAAGNNRNLNQALNFIEVGGEGFDVDASEATSSAADAASALNNALPAVATGFKCEQCNLFLPNDELMMAHASETQHSKFSQANPPKPLTEEEKTAKAKEIVEKIRLAQELKDQKTPLVDQKSMDHKEGKRQMEEDQEEKDRRMKEYAEMRRRQKAEDDVDRKKILEQIKLDAEERRQRMGRIEVVKKEVPVIPKGPEEGCTMLQIRLAGGKVVKQEFKQEEKLSTVYTWIETNHPAAPKFRMMTPFPRKEFAEEDMEKTLQELKLIPSANIVVVSVAPPSVEAPETPESDEDESDKVNSVEATENAEFKSD